MAKVHNVRKVSTCAGMWKKRTHMHPPWTATSSMWPRRTRMPLSRSGPRLAMFLPRHFPWDVTCQVSVATGAFALPWWERISLDAMDPTAKWSPSVPNRQRQTKSSRVWIKGILAILITNGLCTILLPLVHKTCFLNYLNYWTVA